MGSFSDRWGRKPILVLSLLLTTLMYFFIALSLEMNLIGLMIPALFLAGLSEGNIVIAQSAIADVTDEKDRVRLFGYIYFSASSAYVIGPLVGGKLANPSLVSWFGYSTPFWATLFLLVITLIWTYFYFRETHLAEEGERIHYMQAFTNLKNVFVKSEIRILYFINFLIYISIYGFFRSYPMYIVGHFHLNVSRASEFIAWVAVPIIISNMWLTGFLSKKISPKILVFYTSVLLGIFMLSILIFPSVHSLWATLFLTALALGVCLPSLASMLSLSVSNEMQRRVMGNNQALAVGAEALSGLLGGALAALFIPLPLIILAIIAFIGAWVLFRFLRKTKVQSP